MSILKKLNIDGSIYDIGGGNWKDGAGENSVKLDSSSAADGSLSLAAGIGTKAINAAESAFGKYNYSDASVLLSVGIGTADDSRKNAVSIADDGSLFVLGVGGYTGTSTEGHASILKAFESIDNKFTGDINDASTSTTLYPCNKSLVEYVGEIEETVVEAFSVKVDKPNSATAGGVAMFNSATGEKIVDSGVAASKIITLDSSITANGITRTLQQWINIIANL